MWIEKRKRKKGTIYIYREYYTDRKNKKKTVSVSLDSNNKKAQNRARKLLYEKIALKAEEELTIKQKVKTFECIALEWLEYQKPKVKSNTHQNHSLYIKNLINMFPKNISDITAIKIKDLIHEFYYVKNYSYSYVKSHLCVIKSIFRYALERDYVKSIAKIELIQIDKKPYSIKDLQKTKNKFLNKEELKHVIKTIKDIDLRKGLLFEFQSRTGLRIGELLALRECDYNRAKKIIHVNGTIRHDLKVTDEEFRGTPKNIYSYRDIVLDDRCISILNYFIADNKRMFMWFKHYEDRGYIFTSMRGNPYNPQQLGRLLRTINCNGKSITTHMFRHTHISMLSEMNVPLKAIMERVGHNEPRTTLAIYTHVTQQMRSELIEKLNNEVI